ncbi:MAG: hydrogenobyrinic acid a,c-diamide synthase (glutamine-hydrolyzing) [Gammaproteobacteria bacterium]|nr:hydrogenobyrinic acid a,c-diamide synthase (glutamine-hydrolyzing) [Gammaproteobacteria bacterium]MDH5801796.1 hydrogenobyrinic acid a,c-diamide synthase (glutamine-hydrolyzing) [Gammaproteobacteria bacterium]
MNHLLISAAHKSSGKTTLSIGLCRALSNRKLKVQAFKKGPDYIDPMWLGMATGRPCYNLDFNTMSSAEQRTLFAQSGRDADICLIEGNKGLYDGVDLYGSNSNAALAKLLRSPVIIVIDTQGMTRGVAPLVLGYQNFDPLVNIAGVILNKVGGSRHESKLRNVLEHYTSVPVLGAVHRNTELTLLERHLGLIPSNELAAAEQHIDTTGRIIAEQVNLDTVLELAQTAPSITVNTNETQQSSPQKTYPVRIGIAKDAAFGFYYPDDLRAFEALGARLLPFSPLKDSKLPPVDGLFLGGGFPETHMDMLQHNDAMRTSIKEAIEAGLPVYAECGGLMYLCRQLHWENKTCSMVGALCADTVLEQKPQGRGYVRLKETHKHPWPKLPRAENEIAAHEFHYSKLINLDPNLEFAYEMQRGTGINGSNDGIIYKNVLACYTHQRNSNKHPWVERFLQFVTAQTAPQSRK